MTLLEKVRLAYGQPYWAKEKVWTPTFVQGVLGNHKKIMDIHWMTAVDAFRQVGIPVEYGQFSLYHARGKDFNDGTRKLHQILASLLISSDTQLEDFL